MKGHQAFVERQATEIPPENVVVQTQFWIEGATEFAPDPDAREGDGGAKKKRTRADYQGGSGSAKGPV